MICHECAREGRETAAIGHCRICLVGLCKDHLVASFDPTLFPQYGYGCKHHPERPFGWRREITGPAPGHVA